MTSTAFLRKITDLTANRTPFLFLVDFEKQFPDYKKDEDDLFVVPRTSLKEMITETVKEAMDQNKE